MNCQRTFGSTDVASLGLYGKTGMQLQLMPWVQVKATAAIGWEGNILWLKNEKDLVSQNFTIYSQQSATGRSLSAPKYAILTASKSSTNVQAS